MRWFSQINNVPGGGGRKRTSESARVSRSDGGVLLMIPAARAVSRDKRDSSDYGFFWILSREFRIRQVQVDTQWLKSKYNHASRPFRSKFARALARERIIWRKGSAAE